MKISLLQIYKAMYCAGRAGCQSESNLNPVRAVDGDTSLEGVVNGVLSAPVACSVVHHVPVDGVRAWNKGNHTKAASYEIRFEKLEIGYDN